MVAQRRGEVYGPPNAPAPWRLLAPEVENERGEACWYAYNDTLSLLVRLSTIHEWQACEKIEALNRIYA